MNFNPRTPYGMRLFMNASCLSFVSNFNPRTPYGMRLVCNKADITLTIISIHAPLTGCDVWGVKQSGDKRNFNPRTPYGMRLDNNTAPCLDRLNFNPRTPYGMRRIVGMLLLQAHKFQSTHPLRDATIRISTLYI